MEQMQDVAKDFTSLIRAKKDSNQEVQDLLHDLHKWALECTYILR